MPSAKLLLVDDDPQGLESVRKILVLAGYEVVTAVDGQAALDLLRPQFDFDLVLTDVRMPRLGGLEFLRAISLCGERVPVILMTAYGRVEDAVWAMKFGAVDFLTKPFKRQALLTTVEGALKRSLASPRAARAAGAEASASRRLLGRSGAIAELRYLIDQVGPTLASVLVTGESGTGKELVARLIHEKSARAGSPFVALNCAAVPENLMESELFGFEKGAFTGAVGAKLGLFESADGGTLLLDEIGDMPHSLQAKLLRVLQEGEVRRIGATASRRVDVRVIAATHRDLAESVRMGTFRQDLLYRLEVVALRVAPLREREGDVAELSAAFLAEASRRHGKTLTGISPEALALLETHGWPGNVRELSNVIERAVIFAHGAELGAQDLPAHLRQQRAAAAAESARTISIPLGTSLKDVEDLLIRKTLEATDGDKNMTAKLLGINSRTIYRKLDKR